MNPTWLKALALVCTFGAVVIAIEILVRTFVRGRVEGHAINLRLKMIGKGRSHGETMNLLRRAESVLPAGLPPFLVGTARKFERMLMQAQMTIPTSQLMLLILIAPVGMFFLILVIMLAERAGISALKSGKVDAAIDLLNRSTKWPAATWRAWNARGVAADYKRDWTTADVAYAKAVALAPDEAEIVNNQGWSLLLRGDWKNALGFFERAAARSPKSPRIANNLELARAALATELPRRQPGEADQDWAARLNDAGVAAQIMRGAISATFAFTRFAVRSAFAPGSSEMPMPAPGWPLARMVAE